MIKEIESTNSFRSFLGGATGNVKLNLLKCEGMAFPVIYASSITDQTDSLSDVLLELFQVADLNMAHVFVPSANLLQAQFEKLSVRLLAITRPDANDHANYHLYEISKVDLEMCKKGVNRSSVKSYGIHSPEFLQQEVKRLKSQNVIGGRYIETLLEQLKLEKNNKVIDLGCGVGSLIAPLAEKYPELNFLGIDSEVTFIEAARANQFSNLKFEVGDLFAALDTHRDADLYILRYVVQHLGQEDFERFLSEFKRKARPGSRLLIYDSDDRLFTLEPELKEANFLLEAAGFAQSKYGGNRVLALGVLALTAKYGLTKEYFDIDYWDTTKIPFSSLLAILKPLFQDKPDPQYLNEDHKTLFFNRLRQLPDPYMRGGMIVCCVRK